MSLVKASFSLWPIDVWLFTRSCSLRSSTSTAWMFCSADTYKKSNNLRQGTLWGSILWLQNIRINSCPPPPWGQRWNLCCNYYTTLWNEESKVPCQVKNCLEKKLPPPFLPNSLGKEYPYFLQAFRGASSSMLVKIYNRALFCERTDGHDRKTRRWTNG